MILGRLVFPDGRMARIEDGAWNSEDPALRNLLRKRFPVTDSPADGAPGSRQLEEAAKALKASIVWTRKKQGNPEVIY